MAARTSQKGDSITSQELSLTLARVLDDKQARNIRVLDVHGSSSITDFHIIATGTSAPHLKALVSELQHRMKAAGVMSYRKSGTPESGWIVLDFVDAVVHVFSDEARAYYAIDDLWSDAREVPTA